MTQTPPGGGQRGAGREPQPRLSAAPGRTQQPAPSTPRTTPSRSRANASGHSLTAASPRSRALFPSQLLIFRDKKSELLLRRDLPRRGCAADTGDGHCRGPGWIQSIHGSHPPAHTTLPPPGFGCCLVCHQHHIRLLKIKYLGYFSPFLLFICMHYGAITH